MKHFRILIFIACVIFLSYGQAGLALKQAIFPNSSSLQPIPSGIAPNISNNVNSSDGLSQPADASQEQPNSASTIPLINPEVPSANNENTATNTSNNYFWIWGIVIAVVACIAGWMWLRKK